MKTVIKRRDIYKALRTEKLSGGSFFTIEYLFDTSIASCSVCAVGAILRSCAFSPDTSVVEARWVACQATSGMAIGSEDIEEHLKRHRYLSALSCYFEAEMLERRRVTKAFREKLVEFVRDNFPPTISVNIPKKYMKRVA